LRQNLLRQSLPAREPVLDLLYKALALLADLVSGLAAHQTPLSGFVHGSVYETLLSLLSLRRSRFRLLFLGSGGFFLLPRPRSLLLLLLCPTGLLGLSANRPRQLRFVDRSRQRQISRGRLVLFGHGLLLLLLPPASPAGPTQIATESYPRRVPGAPSGDV